MDRLATSAMPTGPRVGISARDCRRFFVGDPEEGQRRLQQAYAELCVELVRAEDADVVFVSTCQGLSSYWADDSRTAQEVVDSLPADVAARVVVERDHHSTAGLRGFFQELDLVVSTRLHGAILALTAGTPVVPIAYEFKTEEVFAQLGQPEMVHLIDDVNGRSLADGVCRYLREVDGTREALAAGVTRLAADARAAGDLVVRAIQQT